MVNDEGASIIGVTAGFLALSLVAVCLRCYVRLRIVKAFGWDDGIMVGAMVLNVAFALCGIIGTTFGIGQKLSYFETNPTDFHKALVCWWLGQLLYVVTCIVAKISIIISLLRITILRVHVIILYCAMALAIVIGLLFFFFTVFQCSPVDYFWNRRTETGSCIDVDILINIAYVYSAGAALTDFTIGLLPVFLIWNLKMNRRSKLAVVGILSIGCIAGAAVIIRAPYVKNYKSREFLYDTTDISIWSNVEAGLGITAGCLSTLRPLFRALRDTTSNSRSRQRAAGSIPLSSNMGGGTGYVRSKAFDRDESRQLWTGTIDDDYHSVMGGQNMKRDVNGSEENLNPQGQPAPEYRVSIRGG
ncbi:integral membrane protein [Aspergillus sp. HF37]|nr:integral membrane protein [Aspergillus sp. HF37]